ncbi:MAG TPA: serine hydrolase domain-containing protein [Isosphaeraceae bacterium]|jgi:CubicO group peptidase (beta-lactamase class C family)|nr:serine hydrolase domain-containing protein [Isosphaeraceae bacterium]
MSRLVMMAAVLFLVAPARSRAEELPKAEPEAVGLSAEKLDELKPALQKLVDEHKIPCAVALIARHGKVAYVTCVGYRDLANKVPVTEDTIFAIASMSKPITCVAAMTLVEQARLGLDDPVEKYLPELKNLRVLGDAEEDSKEELATVPAKRPISVRDLFAHTSGFAYGFSMVGDTREKRMQRAYFRGGVTGGNAKTIAQQVERLGKVPLAHQPGEGWTYGLSHDVLGRVIEVVSGQTFDQFLQERIFKPLDMPDTSFLVPEAKRDRLATTYRAENGDALTPLPKNPGSATFFPGGGGLYSTTRDYTRFAQMLLNGGELDGARILKPETISLMTTNQIGDLSAFGGMKYGLGFGLVMGPETEAGKPVLSRYFWAGAYSTNFWVDPRHDLVAVLMTQVLPVNHGGAERLLGNTVEKAIEK